MDSSSTTIDNTSGGGLDVGERQHSRPGGKCLGIHSGKRN